MQCHKLNESWSKFDTPKIPRVILGRIPENCKELVNLPSTKRNLRTRNKNINADPQKQNKIDELNTNKVNNKVLKRKVNTVKEEMSKSKRKKIDVFEILLKLILGYKNEVERNFFGPFFE